MSLSSPSLETHITPGSTAPTLDFNGTNVAKPQIEIVRAAKRELNGGGFLNSRAQCSRSASLALSFCLFDVYRSCLETSIAHCYLSRSNRIKLGDTKDIAS